MTNTTARLAQAATALNAGDLAPIRALLQELMETETSANPLLTIAAAMCAQANRLERTAAAVKLASENDVTDLCGYELAGVDMGTLTIVSCTGRMATTIMAQEARINRYEREISKLHTAAGHYLTPFAVEHTLC